MTLNNDHGRLARFFTSMTKMYSEWFQIYIMALLVVVVLYTIDDLIHSEETSAN